MQSLCALAHLDYNLTRTHSYSSYFQTAEALGLGRDVRQQLLRRVAFNVMAVNRDDHTKNFAFLLPERGAWALAPDFDVTHSNWTGEWTAAHQMSVSGRFAEITLDDLRALGDLHDVPGIEADARRGRRGRAQLARGGGGRRARPLDDRSDRPRHRGALAAVSALPAAEVHDVGGPACRRPGIDGEGASGAR